MDIFDQAEEDLAKGDIFDQAIVAAIMPGPSMQPSHVPNNELQMAHQPNAPIPDNVYEPEWKSAIRDFGPGVGAIVGGAVAGGGALAGAPATLGASGIAAPEATMAGAAIGGGAVKYGINEFMGQDPRSPKQPNAPYVQGETIGSNVVKTMENLPQSANNLAQGMFGMQGDIASGIQHPEQAQEMVSGIGQMLKDPFTIKGWVENPAGNVATVSMLANPTLKGAKTLAKAPKTAVAKAMLNKNFDAELLKLSEEHNVPITSGELNQSSAQLRAEQLVKDLPFDSINRVAKTLHERPNSIKTAAQNILVKTSPNGFPSNASDVMGALQARYDSMLGKAGEFYKARDFSVADLEWKVNNLIEKTTGQQSQWTLPTEAKATIKNAEKLYPKNNLQQGALHLPEQFLSTDVGKLIFDSKGNVILPEKMTYTEGVTLNKMINALYDQYESTAKRQGPQMTKQEWIAFNQLRASIKGDVERSITPGAVRDALGYAGKMELPADIRSTLKDISVFQKEANTQWGTAQSIFNNKIVRKFVGVDANPDKLISTFANPAAPSMTRRLLGALDEPGKQHFRSLVLDSLFKQGEGAEFSGAKFRNAVDKLRKTNKTGAEKSVFQEIFSREEQNTLNGFSKLLDSMDTSSQLRSPATGVRTIPILGALLLSPKTIGIPYLYSYMAANKGLQLKMAELSRQPPMSLRGQKIIADINQMIEKDPFLNKLKESLFR